MAPVPFRERTWFCPGFMYISILNQRIWEKPSGTRLSYIGKKNKSSLKCHPHLRKHVCPHPSYEFRCNKGGTIQWQAWGGLQASPSTLRKKSFLSESLDAVRRQGKLMNQSNQNQWTSALLPTTNHTETGERKALQYSNDLSDRNIIFKVLSCRPIC